jgi:hypothetical protein
MRGKGGAGVWDRTPTLPHVGVSVLDHQATLATPESAQCQEVIGVIYFTETWRPEALHRGLKIGKSQPQSKVGNFVSCPLQQE